MKKLIIGMIVCVVLLIGGTGCEESERLTPADIQALAAQQEVLQQQVEIVQAAATKMTDELATAGVVDPNVVAKVAKLNKEADRVQAQIALIAQAVKGVPLTGDAAQDFIAQLQAANTASGGFNPYVVPVGTGLAVLNILLGWLAKRKAADATTAKLKYQAHKQGVEKTMKEVSHDSDKGIQAVETKLYDNIGEARAHLGVT